MAGTQQARRQYLFTITHFESDPDRVATPLVLANNALAAGGDVLVWLSLDGVKGGPAAERPVHGRRGGHRRGRRPPGILVLGGGRPPLVYADLRQTLASPGCWVRGRPGGR